MSQAALAGESCAPPIEDGLIACGYMETRPEYYTAPHRRRNDLCFLWLEMLRDPPPVNTYVESLEKDFSKQDAKKCSDFFRYCPDSTAVNENIAGILKCTETKEVQQNMLMKHIASEKSRRGCPDSGLPRLSGNSGITWFQLLQSTPDYFNLVFLRDFENIYADWKACMGNTMCGDVINTHVPQIAP